MATTPPTPQVAFARFVRQAVTDAREERGWSIGDIAQQTGVSRSTLFRWLAGDWQHYPELAKVRSLCATLELPLGAAIRPLAMPNAATTPDPRALAEVDADLSAIRQRLLDDTVSPADKHHIRGLLRHLARRDVPVASTGPQVTADHRDTAPGLPTVRGSRRQVGR